MRKIRAGLVGISGYTGMELARLLARHPSMQLTMACSRAEAGKKLADIYPFLRHLPGADLVITVYEPDHAAKECDIVFFAVPSGLAMTMAPELLQRGLKVVDFSADYRLRDALEFEKWYKLPHASPQWLPKAAYGLPELYASEISRASLVANPGCYPTASILALYAALKNDLIHADSIIIDAKSGASGAGRKAALPTLFCEVSDNFRAYGVPNHRHTPEIEQELAVIYGSPIRLIFTPHLVPMKRGILVTIYAALKNPAQSLAEIHNIYCSTWQNSPWIRVLPTGCLPETVNTRGSMFCDMNVVIDERTGRLIILAAIDNLCRGASGQALANANLMCNLPVDSGLDQAPLV